MSSKRRSPHNWDRPFRIADLSDSVAGQFATRIFADFGEDVVLIESRAGSPIRRVGPKRPTGADGDEMSTLFSHLNGGKRSIAIDLETQEGLDLLINICRRADVIFVSSKSTSSMLRDAGCDGIIVVVSEFSGNGPYAAWRGAEIVHQALSGLMYITGEGDRVPLYGIGRRSYYAAGVYAYIGSASLLHEMIRTGAGGATLEISVHDAAVSTEQNLSTQWSYSRTITRRGSVLRPKLQIKCRDGWVSCFARPEHWPSICEAFHADELLDDPRFLTADDLAANWPEAVRELRVRARDLSVDALMNDALRLKLIICPFFTLPELRDNAHLLARDYWQPVEGGREDEIALGPLYRPAVAQPNRRRPAPRLGSTMPAAVLNGWAPRPATTTPAQGPDARPLHGLRIVDFTSAWAGPMACKILASLGADVIKVEGPNRLDAWRFGSKGPFTREFYPEMAPGDRPWNRSAWFNSQNHDKRALGVDLKSEEGRRLVESLAITADGVMANWSPGVLDRLGFGFVALSERNPSIIVVEMPAAGNSGPLRDMRGLGPTMEAASGIGGMIGYSDGTITGSGAAYSDPIGALHGAAAMLTALIYRDRKGVGQAVEVAQQEAAMHWIGELLLDCFENDVEYGPLGNQVAHAAPHGAYPTRGDDQWIAISVEGDNDWQRLCDTLQDRELAENPLFSTHEARRRNCERLDAAIGQLTRALDKHELASRLQAKGLAAAPINTGEDIFNDAHLRAAGWFKTLQHPDAGPHEYGGTPFLVNGRRLHFNRVSPVFGQDNVEIVRDLGWDTSSIDRFIRDGVLADRPR